MVKNMELFSLCMGMKSPHKVFGYFWKTREMSLEDFLRSFGISGHVMVKENITHRAETLGILPTLVFQIPCE